MHLSNHSITQTPHSTTTSQAVISHPETEAPQPESIEQILKYELPPGAENERKIKHYTDMLNMTGQYETWWAEREEFCNEAEREDDVETHNII